MRPHGEVRSALLQAAREAPGQVRDLAARAQVGFSAAQYTATRMLASDELVVVSEGRRNRVLAAPAMPPGGETLAAALERLHQAFWQQPDADD